MHQQPNTMIAYVHAGYPMAAIPGSHPLMDGSRMMYGSGMHAQQALVGADPRLGLVGIQSPMMHSALAAQLRAVHHANQMALHQQQQPRFAVQRPVMAPMPQKASSSSRQSPTQGLDLLSKASECADTASTTASVRSSDENSTDNKMDLPNFLAASKKAGRIYIDDIREWDVLCGRGGRSNHHPGNKRYRHVVSEMKMMYRRTEAKTVKTDLSRAIVEHVCAYGGRFIKKDEDAGRYYVLTKAEARKKTSQALRETKELKWTL